MQVVMIGANACGDEVLLASDNAMRMMMMVAMTMTSPLLTAQTLAPNNRTPVAHSRSLVAHSRTPLAHSRALVHHTYVVETLRLIADPLWLIAEPLCLIADPLWLIAQPLFLFLFCCLFFLLTPCGALFYAIVAHLKHYVRSVCWTPGHEQVLEHVQVAQPSSKEYLPTSKC